MCLGKPDLPDFRTGETPQVPSHAPINNNECVVIGVVTADENGVTLYPTDQKPSTDENGVKIFPTDTTGKTIGVVSTDENGVTLDSTNGPVRTDSDGTPPYPTYSPDGGEPTLCPDSSKYILWKPILEIISTTYFLFIFIFYPKFPSKLNQNLNYFSNVIFGLGGPRVHTCFTTFEENLNAPSAMGDGSMLILGLQKFTALQV